MSKSNEPIDDPAHMPDMSPIDVSPDLGTLDVVATQDFTISKSQEETRSRIALNFTYVFLTLVTFCLLLPFVMNAFMAKNFPDPVGDAKELVTLLASVLAGPFGFIVGFYFKQSQDNNSNG